jgi:hypothetical protein
MAFYTVQDTKTGMMMNVESLPDRCPICHVSIRPIVHSATWRPSTAKYSYVGSAEVVFTCPNNNCQELFIGYYAEPSAGKLVLDTLRPREIAVKPFNEAIKAVSPSFCDIYNEAEKAEQYGLRETCGVGYRKSIEFLIKDYLIGREKADASVIQKTALGRCIQIYVDDQKVKAVAERATWLGNDEAHYFRKWVDKDLKDLKTMIMLTVHWIEMEILTAESLKTMPDP